MQKLTSFITGLLFGATVGAVAVLLTTPVSGPELATHAQQRWETALEEGRKAREETRTRLEQEFNQLRQ